MKRTLFFAIVVLLGLAVLGGGRARAELVQPDEARRIAEQWVASVLASRGTWGDSESPRVGEMSELRYEGRLVGYQFAVDPTGSVIVSLRREFAPVKVYSETSIFDPSSEDGPSDLVRMNMARIIEGVEALTGRGIDQVDSRAVAEVLETDYRSAWDRLERGTVEFPLWNDVLRGGDYQEGEILLSTSWDQRPPYNSDCPDSGCFYSYFPGYNTNALVGCAATAASQIMTHWCWPPYGVGSPYGDLYDWPNMYNGCFYEYYAGCFLDRDSDPHVCLTQAQIDAVAELCAEAGQAMLMDYGCDASSAFMDDVESAFENNFRYSSNANVVYRRDYTGAEWFDMIKAQLNLNRPMEYAVLGHAIVCDGWQEPGGIREYHMNYGWDDYYNAWYTLDALHYPSGGELDDERMLRTIHPNVGIGATFSGTYNPGSMPYLYFMVSSEGVSATFNSGQYIQFLPGITVGCFGDHVTFHGGSPQTTLLFTRGDRTQGARLFGGALKIHPGGEVRLP